MSDSTSGARCDVCGLYDARVFDPCGAMWCRVCDVMGLGDLAVREKVAEQAEAMGKLFDETVLFDPSNALGAKLDEALREALAKPIDTAVLYGSSGTDAGDPDTWGERFMPDYAAINERWRKQMGKAAASVPPAVEGLDEINAALRSCDDGVRPDYMGKLQQLLADSDISAPGRLYTLPEFPTYGPPVMVPGIVESLDQADRGYIWKDTQGARWGWTKPHGWLAWNGGVAPYSRGAVGPFVFDGPNLCDENGKPKTDVPEWIKRMQAEADQRADEFVERLTGDSNTAGEPSTSANAEASNVPPRVDYCCGGGANPGGHEWNCGVLKAAQAIEVDESNVGQVIRDVQTAYERNQPLEPWERELLGLPAEVDDEHQGDAVEHPSHYTSSKAACKGCGRPIECIDIVEHMGYSLGNVTKYVWRCDLKWDAIEDLRKARQYLDFEIAKREREAAAGA